MTNEEKRLQELEYRIAFLENLLDKMIQTVPIAAALYDQDAIIASKWEAYQRLTRKYGKLEFPFKTEDEGAIIRS